MFIYIEVKPATTKVEDKLFKDNERDDLEGVDTASEPKGKECNSTFSSIEGIEISRLLHLKRDPESLDAVLLSLA